MKKIENNLDKKSFSFTKEEWWQLMGKELTTFFGTSCYWIPWKVPEATRDRLERAYDIAQKTDNHDLSHFINNVKKG